MQMVKKQRHKWCEADDIIALYLYLYGDAALPLKHAELADLIQTTSSSLTMRKSNFGALATEGGLRHVSKQERRTYDFYRSSSKPELRDKVLGAIRELQART